MFYDHLSAHSPLIFGYTGLTRMIDEDEVGLKEKPEYTRYINKDYIEMRPEAPGLWAKDLIPNFAIIVNCRLGNGQGYHSPRVLGGGEIHTEVHQLPQDC